MKNHPGWAPFFVLSGAAIQLTRTTRWHAEAAPLQQPVNTEQVARRRVSRALITPSPLRRMPWQWAISIATASPI
jgi:hypothetical protein